MADRLFFFLVCLPNERHKKGKERIKINSKPIRKESSIRVDRAYSMSRVYL